MLSVIMLSIVMLSVVTSHLVLNFNLDCSSQISGLQTLG